jgi:transposase
LVPLFEWPEQERYEQIRPLVLFDVSVAKRAQEVGTSASTLYRRLDRFSKEGMESLFDTPTTTRNRLPPAIRRLVVDLKAEYPAFGLNEIANIVHACFDRRPDYRSVARVLEEEPVPLKIVRNYPPYHEARGVREARAAIVELRLSGWSVKAIADYLGDNNRGRGYRRGYIAFRQESLKTSPACLGCRRPCTQTAPLAN